MDNDGAMMRPIRDDQRQCPTCKGTGITPVAKALVCPKCDGERIIHRPIRLGRAS